MTVLTTTACTVTAAGISRPAFADILETLQARFQAIYGSDAYIDPDSKDGQLLSLVALAQDDANAATVAAYNSYSPARATGAALSSNVKINGIVRGVATLGTVLVRLGGTVGTAVPAGSVVSDAAGNRWTVPAAVIPMAGYVDVTATAEELGAVESASGTVTNIETPTRGWQTVLSLADAVPGAPGESDAALRRRQAVSVALPAQGTLEGIAAAVRAVPGVTEVRPYENPTGAVDANGLPARAVSIVARGGDSAAIADAIMRKKPPGTPTYGNTAVSVPDVYGAAITINFAIPAPVPLAMEVTVKGLTGYQTSYGDRIKQALADYVNGLGSGRKVDLGRLYVPAQLSFLDPVVDTYEVNAITTSRDGDPLAATDVAIAYDEVATLDPADVSVVVTP